MVRFSIAIRKQDVQDVQEVQQDVGAEESVNQWITALGTHRCNLQPLQAPCFFQRLVNKPDSLNFEFGISSTDSFLSCFTRPLFGPDKLISQFHKDCL